MVRLPRQMSLYASVALDIVCQDGRGRNVPPVSCFMQTISTCCYGVFIHTASICNSDIIFQISVVPAKVMFSAKVYVEPKCQSIIRFRNKTKYATYSIIYELYIFNNPHFLCIWQMYNILCFRAPVYSRAIHTSCVRKGLEEFFDLQENWGEPTVKSGINSTKALICLFILAIYYSFFGNSL